MLFCLETTLLQSTKVEKRGKISHFLAPPKKLGEVWLKCLSQFLCNTYDTTAEWYTFDVRVWMAKKAQQQNI